MTIYLSGPITGLPDNNRPAFDNAERELKRAFRRFEYLRIINPQKLADGVRAFFTDRNAVLHENAEPSWEDFMQQCVAHLATCTHVLFLDGWERSKGAVFEKHIAETLKIPCFFSMVNLIMEKEWGHI